MIHPRFLADEDFRIDIVFAVLRRDPAVDFVRTQALGLAGTSDDELLELASQDGRIIVSHDRNTMTAAADARLRSGLGMAGLLLVPQAALRSAVVEDLLLIAHASAADEWLGVIDFLPW